MTTTTVTRPRPRTRTAVILTYQRPGGVVHYSRDGRWTLCDSRIRPHWRDVTGLYPAACLGCRKAWER